MRRHMVEGQVRTSDVTMGGLVQAMRDIPRELFLPKAKRAQAYSDSHVELTEGRWLLRPRDFAKLLQAMEPRKTDIALNLASGRGYSCAVLASLVETVVGVEPDTAMLEKSSASLDHIGADNAVVIEGDIKNGAPDQGPFDLILVDGAVAAPSRSWFDQLSDGGRLGVFEMVNGAGRAVLYRRDGGAVGRRELFDAQPPLLPGFEPEPSFVF
ncbi:protein-L-isoaspartate O-methyltransferase [Euryhalocaulis sp.]|nr:protein-L-isoaspartate O-methyltransferase [Euryhalocaulis sp.]